MANAPKLVISVANNKVMLVRRWGVTKPRRAYNVDFYASRINNIATGRNQAYGGELHGKGPQDPQCELYHNAPTLIGWTGNERISQYVTVNSMHRKSSIVGWLTWVNVSSTEAWKYFSVRRQWITRKFSHVGWYMRVNTTHTLLSMRVSVC